MKNKIIKLLREFPPTFLDTINHPDSILEELCKPSVQGSKMIFPISVLELRDVLHANSITNSTEFILFSQSFADKHLKRIPIFLVLDTKLLEEDGIEFGSAKIYDTNELYIKNSLVRIIINEPIEEKVKNDIFNIIKAEKGNQIPYLVSNSVPGISSPFNLAKACYIKKKVKIAQKQISLNKTEENIFNFLKTVKKDHNLNVQMLVAGGWVRDKLLGVENDDIDIAIDMPGYEFAKMVSESAVKYNINPKAKAYQVSLDKSADPNERKSEDELMVGATYLYDMKIEFVPMRTETYPDPNSRQPMVIPTNNPQEDAQRRDLTINSLYYNIETGEVEDYTGGKGIKDLGVQDNTGIYLRTPKEDPTQTFLEDPLRILRVLRFHSRYPGSIIDPKIIDSMQRPEVLEAYDRKVAGERAGDEILKMMSSKNPVDSVKILLETGLYKHVFKDPSMDTIHSDGIQMDQQTPFHIHNLMNHTLEVIKNVNNIMKENNEPDEMRGLINLASLFHDFGKMQEGVQQPHPEEPRMQYLKHERESAKMSDNILKSLGIGQKNRDIVNLIVSEHMYPHDSDKWGKSAIGKFVRRSRMEGKEEEHKDLWKYILYHVRADQMSSDPERYDPEHSENIYGRVQEYIDRPSVVTAKPLLNGYEIMNLIPEADPKTGFIKYVNDILLERQDEDIISTKEEAINLVNSEIKFEILNSPIYIRKNAMNWYKKTKISYTLNEESINDPDVKVMTRDAIFPYKEGDKVRKRGLGLAVKQQDGRIISLKDNILIVKWDDGSKTQFDTNRPEVLHSILERI